MIEDTIELLEFVIHLLSFYIPCTIGTITAFLIKKELYKNNPDKKKLIRNKKFHITFITSIIPSAILTMIDLSHLFQDIMETNKYSIAILIGVIGEEITVFLLSMKNVITALYAIFKGVDGIKDLTDQIMNEDNEKK